MDELVRIIDSSSRNLLLALWKRVYLETEEALKDGSALSGLLRANPAVPLLSRFAQQNIGLLKLSEEDEHSVAVAERLLAILRSQFATAAPAEGAPALPTAAQVQDTLKTVQLYSPLALQVLPGVQRMTFRGMQKLVARLTLRLANLQGTARAESTAAS